MDWTTGLQPIKIQIKRGVRASIPAELQIKLYTHPYIIHLFFPYTLDNKDSAGHRANSGQIGWAIDDSTINDHG